MATAQSAGAAIYRERPEAFDALLDDFLGGRAP